MSRDDVPGVALVLVFAVGSIVFARVGILGGIGVLVVGVATAMYLDTALHGHGFAPYWLKRRRSRRALEVAKAALVDERFSDAAQAFSVALTHLPQHPGSHLGRAFSLETLGRQDEALGHYYEAYFLSLRGDNMSAAIMTDEYMRALARAGDGASLESAVRCADSVMLRFSRDVTDSADRVRLGRGYLLFKLRRDEEARDQFDEVADSTRNELTRRKAQNAMTAVDLVDLARLGMDEFFKTIAPDRDNIN